MTHTALKRNGFSRIPLSSIRQSAKALFKTKEQNRVTDISIKILKKLNFFKKKLYNIITERKEQTMMHVYENKKLETED